MAELIEHFSDLLVSPGRPAQDHLAGLRQLTERALQVLHALAESTEYAKIERDALDGTASKIGATSESASGRLYSPEDTVVSIALVKTPSSAPTRPVSARTVRPA